MPVSRSQFPALCGDDAPNSYLDVAATCPQPQAVLDAVAAATSLGGSAGRGVHRGAQRATVAYEDARARVATHLQAESSEVVFVRSATEGLNGLARGWSHHLDARSEVVVSVAEHHANLLPWRKVCEATGARLRMLPCTPRGDLDLDALSAMLGPQTAVVAVTQASNVTGALTHVPRLVRIVRSAAPQARIVLDSTQALAHLPVHPHTLGVDALVFSGHKAYGPLGVGVVWARAEVWASTQPWLWGGGMVAWVDETGEELLSGPARFEAGTPNHPAAVGLAAALDWLESNRGRSQATQLAADAVRGLSSLSGVQVLGAPERRLGVVSFTVSGVHSHDVGSVLDRLGVAVRVGHHCAQPLLTHLGASSAVRASFGLFSVLADVQRLVTGVSDAIHLLRAGTTP